jgi:hypothetical protein
MVIGAGSCCTDEPCGVAGDVLNRTSRGWNATATEFDRSDDPRFAEPGEVVAPRY